MFSRIRSFAVAAVVLGLPACSRLDPPPPSPPPPSAQATPHPSLGTVMTDVARRFELAGRAAAANRFELAAYEANEISELFEDDVPNAELPKEGPTAQIPGLAKAFLDANAADLKKAAASGDPRIFSTSFERTAAACNACHQASAKPFIQIPTVPGKSVPDLDALAPSDAASASSKPRAR